MDGAGDEAGVCGRGDFFAGAVGCFVAFVLVVDTYAYLAVAEDVVVDLVADFGGEGEEIGGRLVLDDLHSCGRTLESDYFG